MTAPEHAEAIEAAIRAAEADGFKIVVDSCDALGDIDVYVGDGYVCTIISLPTSGDL